MTKQETVKVVTLIVMAYPAAEKLKDENTITAMVEVWANIFKDDNPRLVELAVQKHIATNKWPPNIAEIRDQMVTLEHPEIIPPDVAWAAVSDLLYSSGYGDQSHMLPPLVARCVETIGWDHLKEMHRGAHGGYKPGMDRVTFISQYTPMYEREREKAMLPKMISEAVSKTEKVLGGEAYRQIEAAHQKRRDQDELWDNLMNRDIKALRARAEEKKLLGGNENG
ncbi:MAG: hypothetical protein IJL30_07030 [Clostridia bacterium]|nr:hypothetical protein [Clostridia bacterium]